MDRRGDRKVILIAEEAAPIRDLIQTVLHNEGYDVLAAADGIEALGLSKTHEGPIDLLLTDVEIPHVDGISAYRQISADRANIKVLFISSGIPESLTLPEGVPFLPKPFVTLDALRNTVRELLERHAHFPL